MKHQIKKYQHMNAQGTTTCGIIIDYTDKTFQYYPRQSMAVCCGIQVSKKKIEELRAKCLADGFTEVPAI